METILITGASSGYGLETARHFHAQGWRVIATMRTPREDVLPASDRIIVLPLDVTDPDSIAAAFDAAGPIDVLVNNAGIGGIGIVEATSVEKARELFETNTFGVMATTKAVIPQFRERGSGVVVNVTSSVVLADMPLTAMYRASKMATEGFTASLALELAYVGVRAKIVQPGYCPTTRFTANGGDVSELIPPAYAGFAGPVLESFSAQDDVTTPLDVAEAIWRAVHDTTGTLHFPAGPDAVALAQAR
ncbi:SDR family oxidoreductase [Nocardioides nitrophenolicus]|uniref:SDR family oxidoreductase n=1 Tax=Nocardioides nitrophenolicus TaxID=60489 RepID=UPI00195ED1AA|nr:SDR family oxidoreductase [Nocardioides nitrophenolicus]MBM7519687.1 NAD(P)-dependent dehydrogenase (short-subunit alcohol dehydrogenase family) [Nocardioides nitrophenolicus]